MNITSEQLKNVSSLLLSDHQWHDVEQLVAVENQYEWDEDDPDSPFGSIHLICEKTAVVAVKLKE